MNESISISKNTTDKEVNTLLSLIGIMIVEYPNKIQDLLYEFDLNRTRSIKEEYLVGKVLYAITHRGKSFQIKLSELIERVFPQQFKTRSSEQEEGYITFLVGAVKGISKIAKNIKNNRQNKEQSNDQILASIYAQKQKMEIEKQQLIDEKNRQRKIRIGGVIIGIGLLGVVSFKPIKKYTLLHFQKTQQ